jgi:hypothetical protein
MASGGFLTICIPKYGKIVKVIAPFGSTPDCDMWHDDLGMRQIAIQCINGSLPHNSLCIVVVLFPPSL